MKVLKSVNLQVEYVSRCFRNQMQNKVEHKLTSKKKKKRKYIYIYIYMDIQADTVGMKSGKMVCI